MKIILAATIISIPLFLSGCSKSPKDEALAGIFDGCYITKNKELKERCNCLVDKIDKEFDSKFFNEGIESRKIALLKQKGTEFIKQCQQ